VTVIVRDRADSTHPLLYSITSAFDPGPA
jgi:hypothetical protein